MDGNVVLLLTHPIYGVEEKVLVAAGDQQIGLFVQQGGRGDPDDLGLLIYVDGFCDGYR